MATIPTLRLPTQSEIGSKRSEKASVTQLLSRMSDGDELAREQLFNVVYNELRCIAHSLMRRERPEHTLQPTALVHEASARLLENDSLVGMTSRAYFFAAMARAMRQVLVSHARARRRDKRGGGRRRVPLDDIVENVERCYQLDLIAVDQALTELEHESPRHGRVVTLRFFLGLSIEVIAQQVGVSRSTVIRDLRLARVWLARQISSNL